MAQQILNPKSGRFILIGKRTYNSLLRDGYIHDKHRNVLLLKQANIGGGVIDNESFFDRDIPDIGVEPLKPTAYKSFKSEIVKNSGKMARWLWKLIQNRSKNANQIADWILNMKDKIVNKILPSKVVELVELSKNTIYKKCVTVFMYVCGTCYAPLCRNQR